MYVPQSSLKFKMGWVSNLPIIGLITSMKLQAEKILITEMSPVIAQNLWKPLFIQTGRDGGRLKI